MEDSQTLTRLCLHLERAEMVQQTVREARLWTVGGLMAPRGSQNGGELSRTHVKLGDS